LSNWYNNTAVEIDFFRGLTAGESEKRQDAINQRYCQLLQEEGDKILPEVTAARERGDEKLIQKLQKQAKSRIALIVALEYGLIPAREPEVIDEGINPNFIPPIGDC